MRRRFFYIGTDGKRRPMARARKSGSIGKGVSVASRQVYIDFVIYLNGTDSVAFIRKKAG